MVLVFVLLLLTGLFTRLPEATLAAVIIIAVTKLIDLSAFRQLYGISKSEFLVAVTVLVGVLGFGMLWGVFIGTVLSLLITIGRVSSRYTEVLGRVPEIIHFVDRKRHPETEEMPGIFVYRVDAQLFYANASMVHDDLLDRVDKQNSSINLVVFDLISSPTIDLAAVEMLTELEERLDSRGIRSTISRG